MELTTEAMLKALTPCYEVINISVKRESSGYTYTTLTGVLSEEKWIIGKGTSLETAAYDLFTKSLVKKDG